MGLKITKFDFLALVDLFICIQPRHIHFSIGDMHDGVIYYEDQTALSCFYCQANFNDCFFVPRRGEKSE